MSLLATAMENFQAHPQVIDRFCETLRPELIAEALEATGTASIRRRKLPAEQVVWLTIGMAMFTNTSIRQTLDRLNLTLNGKVVPSTISDARKRLGPKPLAHLFSLLAKAWTEVTPSAIWKGFRLFGIDGTTMRVPDSDENLEHFGKPGSDRAEAAYPQARVVAVMDLGLRILHAARLGPLSQGENTLAADMLIIAKRQPLPHGPRIHELCALLQVDRGRLKSPLCLPCSHKRQVHGDKCTGRR
jgi:hypothetical protein